MKRLQRIAALLLSALLLWGGSQTAVAEAYARITSSRGATVIQVIDGESMRVRLTSTNEIALVRLLCVDASGRDDAFNYLASRLLGQYVVLETDPYLDYYTDRWNLVYMSYQGQSVNAAVLEAGFGQLETAHKQAMRYNSFTDYQDNAKANEAGRWAIDTTDERYSYSGNGVNINTATTSQLRNILNGISGPVAVNIVNYREDNPFNSIGEIKFVSGFTKEMFDNNRRYMTVSTNINTATREELSTLADIDMAEVEAILDYRLDRNFGRIYTLVGEDILSSRVYNANEPFIDTSNRSSITLTAPDRVVNINTATRDQLTNIGLTARQAEGIIEYRKNYSYKTLDELEFVPGAELDKSELDELSDNMRVMTPINNAAHNEIRSLLGSAGTTTQANNIYNNKPFKTISQLADYLSADAYNKLKPFVYISGALPARVNINTATRSELTDAGLTSTQAASIVQMRPFRHSGDLPANLSDENVALYTNINEAGREELKSLGLSDSLIDNIIDYRRVQPFGSQSELRTFFSDQKLVKIYDNISDFVVFR